jgi:hypothetical protein
MFLLDAKQNDVLVRILQSGTVDVPVGRVGATVITLSLL